MVCARCLAVNLACGSVQGLQLMREDRDARSQPSPARHGGQSLAGSCEGAPTHRLPLPARGRVVWDRLVALCSATDRAMGDQVDLDATVAYVLSRGHQRVALQFPDDALTDSPFIAGALRQALVAAGSAAQVAAASRPMRNAAPQL